MHLDGKWARERLWLQDLGGCSSSADFLRPGVVVSLSPNLDFLRLFNNWAELLLNPWRRSCFAWKPFLHPHLLHEEAALGVGSGLALFKHRFAVWSDVQHHPKDGTHWPVAAAISDCVRLLTHSPFVYSLATVLMPGGCWHHQILTDFNTGDTVSWGFGGSRSQLHLEIWTNQQRLPRTRMTAWTRSAAT